MNSKPSEPVKLLHDDFRRCDECDTIVLIHGRGECLELDDAAYCPRCAIGRMDHDDWEIRWGSAMELLQAIRDDGTKAIKYELIDGVGYFYAIHHDDHIYELWRRCETEDEQNYTTISETSLVRNIERRTAGSALLYDPPHLVDIDEEPINAEVVSS